jgi:D-3-phosphoglycerate dehydrogenase / 2-oxoglutarate reductase
MAMKPCATCTGALAETDVVTLHCPLAPATRHLMDEAAFAA